MDRNGQRAFAYLGVQLAFTFYLATLQGFGPSADVTEFRDRFVGVVVGVIVMSLVFAFVWPERADSGARRSLAAALRRMARLAQSPADFGAERAAAWQSLDEADRLGRLRIRARGSDGGRTRRDQTIRSLGELAPRRSLRWACLPSIAGIGDPPKRRRNQPGDGCLAISIGRVLTGCGSC
jgi:uncharacterized membrane protein YccC